MPINLFDCFLVAFLIIGLLRGRKHGLSEELLRMLKWLILMFGCALVYRPLGMLFLSTGIFGSSSAFTLAYLGAALVILLVFSRLARNAASKLEGSDAFGRAEYYLGMGSGFVRYGCILIVGLALLNARAFTPAELRAMEKYQQDAYGSEVFPTLRNLQELVFEQSLSGSLIKNCLGFLLIDSTSTDATEPAPAGTPAASPPKELSQVHRGT